MLYTLLLCLIALLGLGVGGVALLLFIDSRRRSLHFDRYAPIPFTEKRVRLRLFFHLLNIVGDLLQHYFSIQLFALPECKLMASRDTSIEDELLGAGAAAVHTEGLHAICSTGNAPSSPFTAVGRICVGQYLSMVNNTRNVILKYIAANRDILKIPVKRPIVILGMPRTGSTLLYNLLACDPTSRVLQYWEQMNASPPPSFDREKDRARIKKEVEVYHQANMVMPEFHKYMFQIHYYHPEAIEEEFILLSGAMLLFSHSLCFGQSEYTDYFLPEDNKNYAYRYLALALKYYVTNWPDEFYDHYVLKTPMHCYFPHILLQTMEKELSGGCMLVTHRDPKEAVPSTGTLVGRALALYYDEARVWHKNPVEASLQTKKVGQAVVQHLTTCAKRLQEARLGIGFKNNEVPDNIPITDIYYNEFIADPIRTVKQIYNKYGYKYTEEYESAMRNYLQENKQHKYGKPNYSLEQFGLTEQDIEREFADYYEEHPKVRQAKK